MLSPLGESEKEPHLTISCWWRTGMVLERCAWTCGFCFSWTQWNLHNHDANSLNLFLTPPKRSQCCVACKKRNNTYKTLPSWSLSTSALWDTNLYKNSSLGININTGEKPVNMNNHLHHSPHYLAFKKEKIMSAHKKLEDISYCLKDRTSIWILWKTPSKRPGYI